MPAGVHAAICVAVCPFTARYLDEEKQVAVVKEYSARVAVPALPLSEQCRETAEFER